MNKLLNKSGLSLGAAKFLLESNAYYHCVVHCAYYSCVQMMKYIVLHKLGISNSELILDQNQSGGGSHERLINAIYKHLQGTSVTIARNVNADLVRLKKMRFDADYTVHEFDYKKAKESITLSEEILKELRKI